MIDIQEVMVLQHRKDTSLLELLESHTEGYTLEVAIQLPFLPMIPLPNNPKRKEKVIERVKK